MKLRGGKVFPENGKLLVICLCACHLGSIRVPLVARVPRVGIPGLNASGNNLSLSLSTRKKPVSQLWYKIAPHVPRRQAFHCKLRYRSCSSAQRQVFHWKLRNHGCSFIRHWIGAVASRCFSHPTLSLTSEQTWKDPRGTNLVVRRVDLANWALWNSPKYTTGVKYQFHQGFWPDQRSGNPNHPSSPVKG